MLSLKDIHVQGVLYFKAGNTLEAKKYWTLAANEGEPSSMFCLGILYLAMNTCESAKMAQMWFEKAEEAGHKNAYIQIEHLMKGNCAEEAKELIRPSMNRNQNSLAFETVLFGNLEWYILYQNQEQELLITKNIIDIQKYNDTLTEKVTWENSKIRNWLNTCFYNTFTTSEKMLIKETETDNLENPIYGTYAGRKTIDKIFLLSVFEVIEYFQVSSEKKSSSNLLSSQNNNPALVAYVKMSEMQMKDACKRTGLNYFMIEDRPLGWWLRTPGADSTRVARINCNGALRMHGREANRNLVGIRPALWKRRKSCE